MKNSESEIVSLVSLTGITPAALETIAKMPKCFARDIALSLLGRGNLQFLKRQIVNHAGQEVGRHGFNELGAYIFSEQFDSDCSWGWGDNGIKINKGVTKAFTCGWHWIEVSPDGVLADADPHYGDSGCGFWGGLTLELEQEKRSKRSEGIKKINNMIYYDSPIDLKVFSDPEVHPFALERLMISRPDCPINLSRLGPWSRAKVMAARPDCPIDLSGMAGDEKIHVMIYRRDCPIDPSVFSDPNVRPWQLAKLRVFRPECCGSTDIADGQ